MRWTNDTMRLAQMIAAEVPGATCELSIGPVSLHNAPEVNQVLAFTESASAKGYTVDLAINPDAMEVTALVNLPNRRTA